MANVHVLYHQLNADGSVKKGTPLAGVAADQAGDVFRVAAADLPFDPAAGDVLEVMDAGENPRAVSGASEDGTDWLITAG